MASANALAVANSSRAAEAYVVTAQRLAESSPAPNASSPAVLHNVTALGRWNSWVTTVTRSAPNTLRARTQESHVSNPA